MDHLSFYNVQMSQVLARIYCDPPELYTNGPNPNPFESVKFNVCYPLFITDSLNNVQNPCLLKFLLN